MAINLPSYLSNAFQLWIADGTASTVTLTPAGGSPISVAGVVSGKLSRPQMEQMGEIGLDSDTRSFSLPVASLGGTVPARGDVITENDVNWRIQMVDLLTLDTRYKAACIKNR